ncbi:hypothetical protein FPZ12_005545 [Amycolatopsis acidicola]|uniref:Uncharacterized protein n=1 Tax=Amycolatopsis acidicola TaxID=2596893 RepID=A0A5N0VJJ3_9PSEU|nr:hypothetical protein [Amycolatopsis acidicola]KAA9165534.1 hypothetical protein FPZ12_005545 [Amycolatopsis acidicola]
MISKMTRRALVITGAAVLLAACTGQSSPEASDRDLADVVSEFASALSPRAPYRIPGLAERSDAAAEILAVLENHQPGVEAEKLGRLGFTVTQGMDSVTGRRYVLIASRPGDERGWGFFLIDQEAPRLVVEVPHPGSDLHTEKSGIALYRQHPGSVLLMAGAHRRAGDRAADVAHREDTVFHAVAAELMRSRLPQLQIHGFDDDSLPDKDVIISAGAGKATAAHRDTATALEDANFSVCRSWSESCGDLEGKTNVQGRLAAQFETPFVHLETNRATRDDAERQAALVKALGVFTQ